MIVWLKRVFDISLIILCAVAAPWVVFVTTKYIWWVMNYVLGNP